MSDQVKAINAEYERWERLFQKLEVIEAAIVRLEEKRQLDDVLVMQQAKL